MTATTVEASASSHTKVKATLDYVAWGWMTAVAAVVLLVIAALLVWGLFEAGRWAFKHWDWATVIAFAVAVFTWWCAFRIQKTERPPWCADKSDEEVAK